MPFFSIIIPTYNCETTLAYAVDSILNQKFEDFELLVIDGYSTDNTISIVKKYNDSRIKIYSEKDRGVYDAMNKGIKIAKGDWLYFLGSDDCFHNEKVLENVHSHLSKHDKITDVLYGNISSVKYGTKYDGEFDKHKILKKNIGHQSIFYNRRIFEKLGGYSMKYKILADYDFNLRWILNDQISSKYIDIIIADYASGGISDKIDDYKFYKDFNYLILKYKYRWVPSIIFKYYCTLKSLSVFYLKK